MNDFGALLADAISQAGLTRSAFAKQAGVQVSVVSSVIRGKRRPPPKHHRHWADVLGLTGAQREEFLDAASIACSPARTRQVVTRLGERIEDLQSGGPRRPRVGDQPDRQ